MVPSDVGETSKTCVKPPPEKPAALVWVAVPEVTMPSDSNHVTLSPKSTTMLIVAELVGLDCVAVIVGAGPVLSG